MNVVLRWFTRILIGLVAVAIALTATALIYGRVSEWRLTAATRIDTPNGIESLEDVEIGGVEQTIYLRSHDRNKPVMLFVHGGPGAPEMHAARDFGLRLEEHFIVVHWDPEIPVIPT